MRVSERACCNQGVPGSFIFRISSNSVKTNAKTKHSQRSLMISVCSLCVGQYSLLSKCTFAFVFPFTSERVLRVRFRSANVTTFLNWLFAVCHAHKRNFRFRVVWTDPYPYRITDCGLCVLWALDCNVSSSVTILTDLDFLNPNT